MNELVFLQDIKSEPFTTSDIIAEQTGNSYRSIQRIIEKHITALETFGRVRFEITPFKTKGGLQDKKIYPLNKQQATLLITFLQNTDIVVSFKLELVRQFFNMKQELSKRKVYRSELVKVHKSLADTVMLIPPHEHAKFDYAKYNNLAYMIIFGMSAKKIKAERQTERAGTATDYLTAAELEQLLDVKDRICLCIEMGMEYSEIKKRLPTALSFKNAV